MTIAPGRIEARQTREAAIADASTESEVRQIVEEINERIRSVNRMATAGPPSNLMPLDLERTLERWHATR